VLVQDNTTYNEEKIFFALYMPRSWRLSWINCKRWSFSDLDPEGIPQFHWSK